ncbi:MAG: DUF2268 domain-containing protein [Myxococcota bacterium]|nr:DUF2268 domain-containing protein [Myxococcota bacterium]
MASRLRLLPLLLLGLACHRPPPTVAASSPSSYRVHDLTETFWSFWDEAQHLPEEDQVRLFEARVVAAHPEVYTAHVLGLDPGQPFSAELRRRWPRFLQFAGAHLPLARKLSAALKRDLPGFNTRFQAAFPDFSFTGDIYFMVSVGGFDGGTRRVNGRVALLFGLDIIARVYGDDAELAPFFHHELFHLYQEQFPDPLLGGTLAGALWREGLAVYAADKLNPGASQTMLLGLPPSTPARVRADLPRLASELRRRLDSRTQEDYANYFLGSGDDQDPPARAGYTLGYLVSQELASGRSPAELIRLSGTALRQELNQALRRLEAKGP